MDCGKRSSRDNVRRHNTLQWDSEMNKRCITFAVALVALGGSARAGVDCSSPPFGDTYSSYSVFVDIFGPNSKSKLLDDPDGMLSGICKAKFENDPGRLRTLHSLGISDAQIRSKTVVDLAGDFISALKRGVDNGTIPVPSKRKDAK
jgi:hypothetical protein